MKLVKLTSDYVLSPFDCGDTDLNDFLFEDAKHFQNYSAFRFISVDAYLSAIPFYLKNGFIQLTQKEEDEHTRLMFFDMLEVA